MKDNKKIVIYPGSFDPLTLWHIEVIQKTCTILYSLCGRNFKLLVAIGSNEQKEPMFCVQERVELCKQAISQLPHSAHITVQEYSGTIFDFAFEVWSRVLVRGIRDTKDLEDESQLQQWIKSQTWRLETMYVLPDPAFQNISSSLSKELLIHGERVEEFVHLGTKQYIEAAKNHQYKANITGTIAAGKSYLAQKFVELGKQWWIPVYNQDLDEIAHKITNEYMQKSYQLIRDEINSMIDENILDADGMVMRKELWDIVFADTTKLDQLNNIMREPIRDELVRSMKWKPGLHLINAALIAEWEISQFGNNITILLDVDAETQTQRLKKRWYSQEEIHRRVTSQFTTQRKLEELHTSIKRYHEFGTVIQQDISKIWDDEVQMLFQKLLSLVDVDGRLRYHSLLYRMDILQLDQSLSLQYDEYLKFDSTWLLSKIHKINNFYVHNLLSWENTSTEYDIWHSVN